MKTILFAVMCVIAIAVHAQEMPYRLADLDGDFALTKSQLRQAAQVARVAAQEKRQPQGADVELYGAGTATLDLWLNVSPQSKAEVPDAPAYHRFVFRDGLPVALYRHGDGEPRLSCAYFYDRAMAPVAAVSYDGKKKTSRTACLIYDKDRRVKRVVEFDAEQKAAFALCFLYPETGGVERWRFRLGPLATLVDRSLEKDGKSFRREDGAWIETRNLSAAGYLAKLKPFGVKPLYFGAE